MQNHSADNPGIIAPPPFIYGAAFLTGVLIHLFLPYPIRLAGWTSWVGWILVLMAAFLVSSGIRTMNAVRPC